MADIIVKDDGGMGILAVDMGDMIMPPFKMDPDAKKSFDNLPNLEMRDDDIMLCTFPKTGTNWMYEVLSMLLNRSAKRIETSKVMTMIEAVPPMALNSQPSPRVVNTHVPLRFMPLKGMREKKTKTVLCLRNPKDTAVSFFNHMTGLKLYNYPDGKWENWLGPYINGKLEYGKYASYLNEWQQAIEEDSLGFPVHVMYFEDMKLNGLVELDRLSKFLGLDIDEILKREIEDMCGFDKMAKDKLAELEKYKDMRNNDFKFFRKGQIGDWKNWFTIAQNEMFDETWKRDIRKDTMFNFTYTS